MENREREARNLIHKLEALIYSLTCVDDYEAQKLQAVFQEPGYEELRNMSLSIAECHVVDCIERNEQLNTTALAKTLNITKGGISKIAAKLLKKGLIEVQRLANNQKEIYYRLTPLGVKIFQAHAGLHLQAEQEFIALFSTYSQDEMHFAGKFLADLLNLFQGPVRR
jgi:DNA-binding MarR family transcriptional regulator